MTRTLLRAERLFDGEKPITDAAVLIEDGRIAWVGKRSDLPRRASGATEPEPVPDATLLPGFIDCHVHLSLTGSTDIDRDTQGSDALFALRAYENASRALRIGVTTQRDLGAPTHAVIELARAIERGGLIGPNLVACGRGITTTGGHGWQIGRTADGPDEVRKAAREQLFAGASVIKIFATGGVLGSGAHPDVAQLTEAESCAAVEEAHKAHVRATAHAHAAAGMRVAIEAGIDSIEHATLLDADLIRLCRERNVALVPTFAALRAIVAHPEALDPAVIERARGLTERHREGIRAAHKAGVRVATGTDAGTPFNPTDGYVAEIEALLELGFSAEDALRAATSVAADVVARADVGRVREGARADLVALRGDPLRDATALRGVVAVWKDGRPVPMG
jgi:imidazolonepropionase-like amidohydrolase